MKALREFKPVEKIIIQNTEEDLNPRSCKNRRKEVTVIKQYPHYVLVQDAIGNRQCVTNAEIYTEMMEKREKNEQFRLLADAEGKVIGAAVKKEKENPADRARGEKRNEHTQLLQGRRAGDQERREILSRAVMGWERRLGKSYLERA